MEEMTSFGAWLKRRRKALDLTQEELALRAGCAVATIKKWETNQRRPSKSIGERLADCLELDPAQWAAFTRAARSDTRLDTADLVPAPSGPIRTHTGRSLTSNLPPQLTPLIGRDQEVVTVRRRILRDDTRLLTLTGPGGIGKTRLALHVAGGLIPEFEDGVFFVPLTPIHAP